MTDLGAVLEQLKKERARLDRAIAALSGLSKNFESKQTSKTNLVSSGSQAHCSGTEGPDGRNSKQERGDRSRKSQMVSIASPRACPLFNLTERSAFQIDAFGPRPQVRWRSFKSTLPGHAAGLTHLFSSAFSLVPEMKDPMGAQSVRSSFSILWRCARDPKSRVPQRDDKCP